ncbi:extracellular solute-binding protein [Paenibacillus doosanensis]|uniref:extracellular solute-binding protein n=1 Tax=Paenibacillus doosanensis TaxID=1229154 RepID=UPI0021800524|nr:extracellular solute-binding protein [Paenibacillus doosanensis]MCS7463508.1 extracellular solute-binding protein [Paenibacillus doosanensis]
MRTKEVAAVLTLMLASGIAAGCSGPGGAANTAKKGEGQSPFILTIATAQVGDIPEKESDVLEAIESYTNTRLDIQWIPTAAYDDKINIMIASNEMPMMLRVKYIPTAISAMKSGMFWEIGPYLKEYKNLSAQNGQFYDNISVDGKVYGIPIYRDIARAALIYRKDWLDALGLKPPATADEWYQALKATALNDPDKNGKNDTYGMVLSKKYNDGSASVTTRLATSLGAPNKWGVENGRFIPEFMTEPFMDMLRMLRKAYSEKLINPDFAVLDESEAEKAYDLGKGAIRIAVAQNAKSMQDRLQKTNPNGIFDVIPLAGSKGTRVSGEIGNNGLYVFPKSTVKTEEDLKKILAFADKMMDPPMSTLQLRGLEGKHFVKTADGKTEMKDFSAFQREVKPYRDSLFNIEGYNVLPLKDTPLGEKGNEVARDNLEFSVPNPALNLDSPTYTDKGKELETMIMDAQTRFILGKIDEAGWLSEVDKWRKAGGDMMIKEYEQAYAKAGKK